MIRVTDLTKEFKLNKQQRKATGKESALAVDNVSFECKAGRIFSLLGPNGAGKTTTLRMISTIMKPTSGKILVNRHDVEEEPNAVRRSIGFLTGSTGLYGRLTPNEVIKYFADLHNVADTDREARKKELYDLLDMNEFANKRIATLSTGMKQKVSIVRTMIHDPQVVVFDEPTSGLDVITAEHIIQLIRNCKEQGKTVIFSSHIMSEVDLLCDDLAIIDDGKLLFNGTLANLRSGMQSRNLTEEFIRIVNEAKS